MSPDIEHFIFLSSIHVRDRMADRKCPDCGSAVPDNSITCPNCFKSVSRDNIKQDVPEYTHTVEVRKRKSGTLAVILAIFPGLLGIMGVGLMYLGHYIKGLIFMLVSFPLMLALLLLYWTHDVGHVWPFLALLLMITCLIILIPLFFIQLLGTVAAAAMRRQ